MKARLWVLTVTCVACLAGSGWYLSQQIQEFNHISSQRDLAQRDLEKARSATQQPAPSQAPEKLELAILAAQKIDAGLSPAWADVFGTIEAASSPDITWLGLERAAMQSSIRIEGTARTLEALFEAIAKLSAQPRWTNVAATKIQNAPASDNYSFELIGQFTPMKTGPR